MEPLLIPAADDTPEIILNKQKRIFRITGRSLPEDVIEFYSPIYFWLEQYVADPLEETLFQVRIVYFNSASQRALNEIFNILARINLKNKKIDVEWYYYEDDEEMKESGEEYADMTRLSFQYISYATQ